MKHRIWISCRNYFRRAAIPGAQCASGEPLEKAPLRPVCTLGTSPGRGGIRAAILAMAAVLTLLLSGCAKMDIFPASPAGTLAGVDVSGAVVEEGMDSHGGFHGDGETFQKLRFSQAPDFPEDWQDLPMSEGVHTLLYGGSRETYHYAGMRKEAGDPIFPEVKTGKWFFYDRHSECTDPYDAEAVFDRYSKNFTAALWDEENLVMYYFEYDS